MSSPPEPTVSVVLPAYRLGEVIAGNIARVDEALAGEAEIVVVDDGSPDNTYGEARRAAEVHPRVKVIRHDHNQGKGEALCTGTRNSSGEIVVFLDADLDLPPDQVPALVAQLGDIDMLVGAKRASMSEGRYPLTRRVLSTLFTVFTVGLFRLPVRETQTGLKIARRRLLEEVLPEMRIRGYAYDLEMLVRAHRKGFTIREVPVELGPTASTAPLRASMLWQMGRDTLRLLWWTLTGRLGR
jgi:glycosyltransferase involved in cell wall biosynthesis